MMKIFIAVGTSIRSAIGVLFLLFYGVGGFAQNLKITIPCITDPNLREEGDHICIPVTVDNFNNIEAIQIALTFNQNLFRVDSIIASPSNDPFKIGNGGFNVLPGRINLLGLASNPVTFPANHTLFTICGTLVGKPTTEVIFQQIGRETEFSSGGRSIPNVLFDLCRIPIVSKNNTLFVRTSTCNANPNQGDGSIRINATGGRSPFNFSIRNGAGAVAFNGSFDRDTTIRSVFADTYAITVTDQDGNTSTANIRVQSGVVLSRNSFDTLVTAPRCAGATVLGNTTANGMINVKSKIPLLNYDYAWSNNFYENGESSTNRELSNGTYFLTVTDQQGCSVDFTFNLNTPVFEARYEIVNAAACVSNNQLINVKLIPTGGTKFTASKEYQYMVTSPVTSPIRRDLPANGIISIPSTTTKLTVLDANACQIEVFNTGLRPNTDVIPIDSIFLSIRDTLSLRCGAQDTTLRITLSSRTNLTNLRIYRFRNLTTGRDSLIDTPRQIFDISLSKGNYELLTMAIPGSNGAGDSCKRSFRFAVVESQKLSRTITVQRPTCRDSFGQINIIARGGVGAYNYSWSHNTNYNQSSLDSIKKGSFRITVSDQSGCTNQVIDTMITIDSVGFFKIDSVGAIRSVDCGGRLGGATVFTSFPGARYRWSNDSTNATISVAAGGIYTVTVTDPSGQCSITRTATITQRNNIQINVTLKIPPQCGSGINSRNGLARIGNISGAARPYSIVWYREGQQAEIARDTTTIDTLRAGRYRIVVRDQNGCEAIDTFTLVAPKPINLRLDSISRIKCSGGESGFASVTASGGEFSTYGYIWSSGSNSPQSSSLLAGPGYVIATQQGCQSDTLKFNVLTDPPFTVRKTVLNPSCRQSQDGRATLDIEGGAAGARYEVIWLSLNRNGLIRDSLAVGNYSYVVRNADDRNCLVQDSVIISGFGPFKIGIDSSLTSLSGCSQNPAGQVGLKLTTGLGPVNYFVNGSPIPATVATGLTPGMYNFVGRSSIGCLDTIRNFDFRANKPLRSSFRRIDSISCAGGQTCIGIQNVIGGSGKGYTFSINLGPNTPIDSCVKVFAGKYKLTLFDSERCVYADSVTIGEPAPFTISLGDDITHELGLPNPTITVSPNSGSITSVKWSTPDRLKCLSAACGFIELTTLGDFALEAEATNQAGCKAKSSINITTIRKENVFVPSVFIPDPSRVVDPENAYWKIKIGTGVEKINDLVILDRWGNIMFQSQNIDNDFIGWNGKRNNEVLPSGVYVYKANIQFLGLNGQPGEIKPYTGSITLIR
jgi:gliding motility-associated-like protein